LAERVSLASVISRERWLTAMLGSIDDAMIAVDLAGDVTYLNATAERLLGRAAAEAIGRPVSELVDPARTEAIVRTSVGTRVITQRATPIIDGDKTIGTAIVIRDVTAEKVAARHGELAERASAVGTLASRLAHQVNNPLAVIVMHAESVRDELVRAREQLARRDAAAANRLDEALGSHLEIDKAVGEIAKIMTDVRAFSQPAPASGQADVGRAIEWAVKASSHEFRDRARVHANVAVAMVVELDEPRLAQLLVNLLSNAARSISTGAAERNSVTIDAHVEDDGERAIIEISDTGAGMTPEAIACAFEPMFFAASGSGVIASVGLGLKLAREVARAVGGEVDLKSTVGQGTTARVVLPLVGRPANPANVDGDRGRVLVIDDDDSYLRGVRRALRGHDVTCCATVGDALAQLALAPFDVVLAEMRMPDMSGIELYERVLRDQPTLASRIVFVAAHHSNDRFAEFLAAVPNKRVEKPMAPATLRALVRDYVASRDP
jgi:signal transduction histidine kinase